MISSFSCGLSILSSDMPFEYTCNNSVISFQLNNMSKTGALKIIGLRYGKIFIYKPQNIVLFDVIRLFASLLVL